MSQETPSISAASAPADPAPPLGDKTASGFFYVIAQFGGTKILAFLGQLVLSWLLKGKDYGYIGLSFTVVATGTLISAVGLHDVLVQRWRDYDHWATPVFWLSVTLGLASTLLTCAAAPLAASFFHDARLTPLICILSTQTFIGSLALLPHTRLVIDLRFKLFTAINFGTSTLIIGLSVFFAMLGFGPYSYILPWPIGGAIRTAVLWIVAPPRVHRRPRLRLWKYLAGDSFLMGISATFVLIASQFDYVILGRMYKDKAIIGQYFWAFNLSMQTLQLLANNLGGVLLPSLARLQDDPKRLLSAFLRAAKVLMVLAVPACLLQATLADPLIKLVFRA